jgi:hypothetical protein
MKPIANWNNIAPEVEGMRSKLQPGGYVIKITGVINDAKKEYLKIVYDIAEGPEAGRYSDDWGQNPDHDYAHSFFRSYKEKALGMFKGFLKTVEDSNPGYTWDWHEDKLAGKVVGVVLANEEYMSNRGEIAVRLAVRSVTTADKIRAGEFTVPDVKKYKPREIETAVAAPASGPDYSQELIPDQDIPF